MSLFDRIQRTIHGRDFGLDRNNNLLMKGSQIILAYDSASPVTLSASSTSAGVVSVSKTLTAGPLNDLGASVLTGFVSGSTNRLILTPAAGGTTINGIDTSGMADNFTFLIQNGSTVDALTFANQAAGSAAANRFRNQNSASVTIPPGGAARCTFVVNRLQFA